MTRYGRTQFADPNMGVLENEEEQEEQEFYENSDDDDEEEVVSVEAANKPVYKMDPDHRLLLRSAKPLLNSRNASVVMATAQMYWHLAPRSETFPFEHYFSFSVAKVTQALPFVRLFVCNGISLKSYQFTLVINIL